MDLPQVVVSLLSIEKIINISHIWPNILHIWPKRYKLWMRHAHPMLTISQPWRKLLAFTPPVN
jgi:hypothetical protein